MQHVNSRSIGLNSLLLNKIPGELDWTKTFQFRTRENNASFYAPSNGMDQQQYLNSNQNFHHPFI